MNRVLAVQNELPVYTVAADFLFFTLIT
ncbi:hypothetical protein CCP3SC1_60014 [Gammaproteobacteria bacterium]